MGVKNMRHASSQSCNDNQVLSQSMFILQKTSDLVLEISQTYHRTQYRYSRAIATHTRHMQTQTQSHVITANAILPLSTLSAHTPSVPSLNIAFLSGVRSSPNGSGLGLLRDWITSWSHALGLASTTHLRMNR